MKHRPDTRGLLYFGIAFLGVWSGEIANLGGAELFARISDLWYGYYQSDDLAEVEALVAQLGLVEADYCVDWPNMSQAQRSQAMAARV